MGVVSPSNNTHVIKKGLHILHTLWALGNLKRGIFLEDGYLYF